MENLYNGWVPIVKKQSVVVAGLPSNLDRHAAFSQDISIQNHPVVGAFYEDWYSPAKPNPPLSYNYFQFHEKENAHKPPARQSIGHLQTPINRQSSSSPNLTILFILSLLLGASLVMAAFLLRPKLENHEMCGITTGGQEECYFDCTLSSVSGGTSPIVTNPSCLQDCFFNEPAKSCITPILNGVLANCPLSSETETLLSSDTCKNVIWEQQTLIRDSVLNIISSGASSGCFSLAFSYIAFFTSINQKRRKRSNNFQRRKDNSNITSPQSRLAPVQYILGQLNIRTKLPFENTKNRYPWLCSLRSTGTSPVHRCAVNLLSIPPSPTVIVGAAHCTYLCKDGTREVPACCCSEGPGDCSESKIKCGDDPGVVEMTGVDSTIICGEWDSSEADSDTTGERYNVQLPITSIVRHPDFEPAKGPINGNDIVVFKVDDMEIKNNVANSLQLWPACLPSQTSTSSTTGIHTGWTEPPPLSFIQSKVPGFESFYEDFYKQWHYKMDIFDTCEDPSTSGLSGGPLQFPSNSSYPAATVCAKDFTRQSCFSTGESGSPLMVQNDADPTRHFIEGILSFVKGCDVIQFGPINTAQTNWILNQQSENPTTYTKLSCFLPWVADQYFMRYEGAGSLDQECTTGSGDPLDGENTCRNTISSGFENNEDLEVECKFPFYYKGIKYEECILLDEDDFVYPIFRCPIRDITTKINGINSFEEFTTLGGGICLSDPSNGLSALDPTDTTCNNNNKRQPFSQCKNNCPGVQAFGIIGGGAVLAGVGTLGALGSFATVAGVGTLGTIGVGVTMMMAQSMCAAPFYCNLISGKCCVVVFSINGLVCPSDC